MHAIVHSRSMPQDKKFIVVLNRNYELSRLTSGMGHVTAGLVASLAHDVESMSFLTYESKDGHTFPWISDHSFVVLKGRGGQMKTLRDNLVQSELPCVTYLDTMLEGGTEVEMAATRERTIEDIDLLAIATFGDADSLAPLTKRFSLWQ